MKLPDGRPLVVDAGILNEPSSEACVILWLPGESAGGYRHWERVATVARAAVTTVNGVCSIAATSVPLRQRLGGSLGKLLDSLSGSRADRAWTLPGGAAAEQCGARRSDLRLAWAEDATAPLNDAWIKAHCPPHRESQSIGPNLYLLSGVEPATPRAGAKTEPRPEATPRLSPRALAEQALGAARAAGDRHRMASALADLGLAFLLEGATRDASAMLEEARDEARLLGDPALEADALSNLALASCLSSQPTRARELIGPALEYACAAGDRYAEKLALDRLALADMGLGDHPSALTHTLQAAAVANELGDRQHEADLLWRAALEHAELGRRDQAITSAATAVDLLRRLGNPTADWYAHHLANYRSGAPGPTLAISPPGAPASYLGGSIDAGALTAPRGSAPAATGPGPLRMALTAAKAMAAFVGSGFKTASPERYRARFRRSGAAQCTIPGFAAGSAAASPRPARMLHSAAAPPGAGRPDPPTDRTAITSPLGPDPANVSWRGVRQARVSRAP